ncbi:hypothetical protein Syun_027882 [Stephania yunnanensis]|uniref:glutathione transferase n=1 Tax=Stephania yunnanensis TaxID=152371 RepID=A0AAP0HQM3_9MAGN
MSKNDEVILLDFWASPFAMRVKIALAEKGIKFEAREEDIMAGKSELLLNSNPLHKKVPVLLHYGKPICESAIIVSYIDEVWPFPALLPTCYYARAQARFWADFVDKKVGFHPYYSETFLNLLPTCYYARTQARFWADFVDKKLFDGGCGIWRNNGDALELGKKEFIEILQVLEGALGGDFFGGDNFGFVDTIAIPHASWFYAYEQFGGFKVEDACPKLSAWIERCLKRDSVAKSLPDPSKVYEFLCMFRKMNGLD